jgi:hypothetical protein
MFIASTSLQKEDAGNKRMSLTQTSLPAVFHDTISIGAPPPNIQDSTEPLASVRCVLPAICAELRALKLLEAELSERIATIRRTVSGLADIFNLAGDDALKEDLLLEFPTQHQAHHGVKVCRNLLKTRSANVFTIHEIEKHFADNHSALLDLRRACRIALLESFEMMSGKEVYSRIVRRGSFLFTKSESANSAVVRELNCLVREGAAHSLKNGNECSWALLRDEAHLR